MALPSLRLVGAFALSLSASLAACSSGPHGADEAVGETASALTVCGQTQVKGVDVSHYQNAVDWKAMKAAGIAFGFAKATEGTTITDAEFQANWSGMKAVGIVRGAYHFFHPDLDPVEQANFVLGVVGSLEGDDLAIALDIEAADGIAPSTIAARALTFLETVTKATGKKGFVYSSRTFLSDFSALAAYPYWEASPDVSCPSLPSAWPTWQFWQHSWTGSVAGTSPLDLDYFNGTLAELLGGGGGGDAGTGDDAEVEVDADPGPRPDPGRQDAAVAAPDPGAGGGGMSGGVAIGDAPGRANTGGCSVGPASRSTPAPFDVALLLLVVSCARSRSTRSASLRARARAAARRC
jgi:lysozyme